MIKGIVRLMRITVAVWIVDGEGCSNGDNRIWSWAVEKGVAVLNKYTKNKKVGYLHYFEGILLMLCLGREVAKKREKVASRVVKRIKGDERSGEKDGKWSVKW